MVTLFIGNLGTLELLIMLLLVVVAPVVGAFFIGYTLGKSKTKK